MSEKPGTEVWLDHGVSPCEGEPKVEDRDGRRHYTCEWCTMHRYVVLPIPEAAVCTCTYRPNLPHDRSETTVPVQLVTHPRCPKHGMNADVEALSEVLMSAVVIPGPMRVGRGEGVVLTSSEARAAAARMSDWLAEQKAEALREARDDLYAGYGPDLSADSDIVYGEWLGNRADRIGGGSP